MSKNDVRAVIAIVYVINDNPSYGQQELTFEERLKSWEDWGYKTHFMTGIAYGSLVPNDKGETLANGTSEWDERSKTVYVIFDNDPDGVMVKIMW